MSRVTRADGRKYTSPPPAKNHREAMAAWRRAFKNLRRRPPPVPFKKRVPVLRDHQTHVSTSTPRPPVSHTRPTSTPRPSQGVVVVASSGRDGDGNRDDGGGSGDDGGGSGDPPSR